MAAIQQKYFDINITGYSIKCKVYCHDMRGMKQMVIFGHGFGGHKDNKAAERFAIKALSKHKELGVLVFNWPCHGDDVRKKLSLTDCDLYLDEVIKYCKETFGVDKLYAYATSFGAYCIFNYLTNHGNPFVRMAFRCPSIYMYETFMERIMKEEDFAKLKKGKDAQVGFDRKINVSQDFLEELKETNIAERDYIDYAEDILILHGTKDEVVPMDKIQEFAENQIIEFVPIEKADHRFSDPKQMDFAIHEILEFLDIQ